MPELTANYIATENWRLYLEVTCRLSLAIVIRGTFTPVYQHSIPA